jgi:myosin heavy subunit
VQCESNRNTLAKALYNRVFEFIIEKMNERLACAAKYSSIGLLDIFGFENFEINSFEQLCINFTNEKLQKLYTRYVFETELDEIRNDGLGERVKDIVPPDNRSVIELIEKGKALSIFGLIDDKTSLGMAKDEDIVADIKKGFGDAKKGVHKNLLFSMTEKNRFTIVHTQSNVTYTIDGFKSKNEDKVTDEINNVLESIFPLNQTGARDKSKTIISKFDVEVKTLMEELERSEVHFVRCIKPNELKVKELLDEAYTLKQVRYLGVLETIKIRKSTFPYRKPYKQFVETLQEVVPLDRNLKSDIDKAKFIIFKLFPNIEKDKNAFLTGKDRLYLSSEYETKLNELMLQKYKRKQEAIVKIQRQWRVYMNRKAFQRALKKLLKLRMLVNKKLQKMIIIKKHYVKIYREQTAKATAAVKERKKQE